MHRGKTLAGALLSVGLMAGCASLDTYPPALPARSVQIPWLDNEPLIPVVAPPPALRYQDTAQRSKGREAGLPDESEWAMWKPYVAPETQCRGKGRKRVCTEVKGGAVDQANMGALVKPTAAFTAQGTSAQTRYPLDMESTHLYEVCTSPAEVTHMLLPDDERLAIKLLLKPEDWEVAYGKSGAEGSRREVLAVRPVRAPLVARGLLVLQSGIQIHLQVSAREKPCMLSVAWERPVVREPVAVQVPVSERPPQFDQARAYAGYTMTVEGTGKLTPPWMPEGVVDDGKSSLIKLPESIEGMRLPVVMGIQQNGAPALVQSRLYTRPGHGAWIFVQGLWPALQMRDAAGLTVKIVREVPPGAQEVSRGK